MKILIISQQWEPEEGTPQRRWAQITDGLVQGGNEVVVIAAPPHYPGGKLTTDDPRYAPGAVADGEHGEMVWRTKFAEHDRSLISRVKDQGIVALSSLWMGLRLVLAEKPDVIVTTAPPVPSAIVTAVVAKATRRPYVVDLRDVWPELLRYMNDWGAKAEANPQSYWKAVAFDALIKTGGGVLNWALRGADAVVTTTPSFAEALRDAGYQRVLNLRNMASVRDHAVPSLADTAYLDGHDRQDGTLRILYAGTTGRAQGLDSALEALRLTVEAGVDATMRVAGSGATLRRLELHARRDQLPVQFLGRISFEEVAEEYEWCDTALIHLRGWEPLSYTVPSKLYEALSIGRHVSVAANGEAARIVSETRAGDAVPAMDPQALADLWVELAHDRERLEVRDRGRHWLLQRETPEENIVKFTEFVVDTILERRQADARKRAPARAAVRAVKRAGGVMRSAARRLTPSPSVVARA